MFWVAIDAISHNAKRRPDLPSAPAEPGAAEAATFQLAEVKKPTFESHWLVYMMISHDIYIYIYQSHDTSGYLEIHHDISFCLMISHDISNNMCFHTSFSIYSIVVIWCDVLWICIFLLNLFTHCILPFEFVIPRFFGGIMVSYRG